MTYVYNIGIDINILKHCLKLLYLLALLQTANVIGREIFLDLLLVNMKTCPSNLRFVSVFVWHYYPKVGGYTVRNYMYMVSSIVLEEPHPRLQGTNI